jgi:hypothetical protein
MSLAYRPPFSLRFAHPSSERPQQTIGDQLGGLVALRGPKMDGVLAREIMADAIDLPSGNLLHSY